MVDKEVNRKVCEAIYNQENYIRKCSRVRITSVNENSPDGQYKQNSIILGAGRETEEDPTSFSINRQ